MTRRASGRAAGKSARASAAYAPSSPSSPARRPITTPIERPQEQFARLLAQRLVVPIELEITDNTYTMISFSKHNGGYRVRLHHMFLDAPTHIVRRLAGYIRGDDGNASAQLDAYIHEKRGLIRRIPTAQRQRRLPLQTRGRVHDLMELLAEARLLLPSSGRNVAIAWAPAPRVRLPRRSIKLGSYSADTQIIRVHPALDQPEVPRFFVRWIVFHELLHHHFRADLLRRRGRIHTPEFCRLERTFPDYEQALAWERRHLDMLLWWDPLPVSRPRSPGLRGGEEWSGVLP